MRELFTRGERRDAIADLSDFEAKSLLAYLSGRWPDRFDELISENGFAVTRPRTAPQHLAALERIAVARRFDPDGGA